MSSKLIFFLCLSTFLLATNAIAQDVPAKLMAFNEAIGKEYNVTNKGKMLLVEGFREGKQVKLDRVNVFDLDLETLKYSEADRTVSVNCYDDIDGCVEQKLLLDKRKSYRKRLVFGLNEDAASDEILEKLKALLTDMSKTY
ncbi:MAG: hypothetical protein GC178_00150 [Flavobacteriales bacterium]|nr:hypothetical protein [Flavobacteriales bacterium]